MPWARHAAWVVVLASLAAGCVEPAWRPEEQRVPDRDVQLAGLHGPSTRELRIVVHAHPGYEPTAATVDGLVEEVGRLTGKPTSVDVRTERAEAGPGHTWTAAEIDVIEERVLAEPWPAGVGLVHVVALPGCYAYNETRPCIAGVSGPVAFVLVEAVGGNPFIGAGVQEPATRDIPFAGWYTAERSLYVHEVGHTVGLVGDLNPDAPRLVREGCYCHSDDTASVMHQFNRGWGVRVGDRTVEDLRGDNLHNHRFSDADLADAAAYRASLA